MKTALIGYSGFVGSNLLKQISFDDCYNSQNIEKIKGKSYDLVYCAGAPGTKWLANKHPKEDFESLSVLMDALSQIQSKKIVLISTVDVYTSCMRVDEESVFDVSEHHAYGKHRMMLESFVSEKFENHHIIRLPGLFGDGLKKNIIFDFLHDNETDKIHSDGVFQFYCLDSLHEDIQKVIKSDIPMINFATEPTSVKEIAKAAFGMDFENRPTPTAPMYEIYTKHAHIFQKNGRYIQSKEEVLEKIQNFVLKQKAVI